MVLNPHTGSKYQYSFSGADAKVLVWFPQAPHLITQLPTVHTLSVSVHESKGQARALGHRGIKGLARGVRTIAGSLILTVINDNPLRVLHEQFREAFIDGPYVEPSQGWSLDRRRVGTGSLFANYDYSNRLATLLPPFNMALQFVSEMGPEFDPTFLGDPDLDFLAEHPEGAGTMVVGMEFLDEGHVTSVQDIVTEITYSFIACDFKPLAYFDIDAAATPPAEPLDLSEHDALMQDLFYDYQRNIASFGDSPSTTKAMAKALGIEYKESDEQETVLPGDSFGDSDL